MIDGGVAASTLVTTAEEHSSVVGWCVDGGGSYQREKIWRLEQGEIERVERWLCCSYWKLRLRTK